MIYYTLQNGDKIPALGLGTWKSAPGEVEQAVFSAIEMGYRHIDCAWIYGNEKEIGSAISRCIKNGIVKREELWITSKLWNEFHQPEAVETTLTESLKNLQLDYLDLYLIHWPVAIKKGAPRPWSASDFIPLEELPLINTWRAMEELVDAKLVKHIGVSNFSIEKLKGLKSEAKYPIATNQIEAHPYLQQPKMLKYCRENNISITGYSPLGSGDRPESFKKKDEPSLLLDPVLLDIANSHKTSVAQIILTWSIQRGTIVIPKSVNLIRMKENLESTSLLLSKEEMMSISKLDKNRRFFDGKVWAVKGGPYTISELWN